MSTQENQGAYEPLIKHDLEDNSIFLSVQMFLPPGYKYQQKNMRMNKILQIQVLLSVLGIFLYYGITADVFLFLETKKGIEEGEYFLKEVALFFTLLIGIIAGCCQSANLQQKYVKCLKIVQILLLVNLALIFLELIFQKQKELDSFLKIVFVFGYFGLIQALKVHGEHTLKFFESFTGANAHQAEVGQPNSSDAENQNQEGQKEVELQNNSTSERSGQDFNNDSLHEAEEPQITYQQWQEWKNMKTHYLVQFLFNAFIFSWCLFGVIYVLTAYKHGVEKGFVPGPWSILFPFLSVFGMFGAIKRDIRFQTIYIVLCIVQALLQVIEIFAIQGRPEFMVFLIYSMLIKAGIPGFMAAQGIYIRQQLKKRIPLQ